MAVKSAKITITIALTLAAVGLGWWSLGFWPDPLAEGKAWDWSVRVTDRHGQLLKEFLPPKAVRREQKPLSEFSPNLISAVLATEDKRFYRHPGVDPLAMFRAAWLNVKNGRIVSGGSTITMQLARLNKGLAPGPRTMKRKLREIWWALLIERHHTKGEILAEYLNRAPCGNLTEGFNAAARVYLDKPAQTLSPAEAAFLAGLPASPGAFDPYKDPRPALNRRGLILRRMAAGGAIGRDELERALTEPLALSRRRRPFQAPHFVAYLRRRHWPAEPPARIRSTLDLRLQRKVEELVGRTVAEYRGQGLSQAAVVVLSLPRREILAWAGSADFFSDRGGQNDGVTAPRQPGSALKPFIYAAAMEDGLISPATLLDDSAADYTVPGGVFSPANYSGRFHGPVPARLALASSLNLPAVKLTEKLGVNRALAGLRNLGLTSLEESAAHYGLGLALGGGEVTLLDLTGAYAALADRGRLLPPVAVLGPDPPEPPRARQALDPGVAWIIGDILADDAARATGFGRHSVLETPYRSSVKTGTSKNFRDNWCVGYTSGFVVGVWAGNFEADPMDQVSGVTGAGHVWREVADFLAEELAVEEPVRPAEVTVRSICPLTGFSAGPYCPNHRLEYFPVGQAAPRVCRAEDMTPAALGASVAVVGLSGRFGLVRPRSGELYAWDPDLPAEVQNIKALAQSVPEVDELIWLLNGRELKRQRVEGRGRWSCLAPVRRGPWRLEVVGLKNGRPVARSVAELTVK